MIGDTMTTRFLKWLKRRGSWRLIERDGAPYLERYILFKRNGVSLYLHRFWSNDPDDLHDHPWRSFSYILKGGYREYFVDGTYLDRKPGDKTLRDATSLHRIELPEGAEPGSAWTLFFTWSRERDWGFLTKSGWENAKGYTRQVVDVQGVDFELDGTFFPKVRWLTNRSTTKVTFLGIDITDLLDEYSRPGHPKELNAEFYVEFVKRIDSTPTERELEGLFNSLSGMRLVKALQNGQR